MKAFCKDSALRAAPALVLVALMWLPVSAAAADVFLVNNWTQPNKMFNWAANYTFAQTFTAAETGAISEIAVYAGNNQNPLNLQVTLSSGGTTLFSQAYAGLRQRTNDWALSFPLASPTRMVKKGEVLTLSITPSTSMGMAAVLTDNPAWPRSNLQGYGNVALKFYVKGSRTLLTATAPANGSITGAGLTCGTVCSVGLAAATATATLTATPNAGYKFIGWGGDCAGKPATCALAMSADKTVSATFASTTNPIAVTIVGSGGYVGVNLGDKTCLSSCTVMATSSTDVRATAGTQPNNRFVGWGGDCAGKPNPCSLDMTSPKAITATFEPIPTYTLTVNRPTGGWIFSSADGGSKLQCGGSYNSGAGYKKCSVQLPQGSTIELTFVQDIGYQGVTWSGDCAAAGTGGICKVAMSANKAVSAASNKSQTNTIAITINGSGGYVGVNLGDKSCSSSCTVTASVAPDVRVTAGVQPNNRFKGWGGDCAGQGNPCSLNTSVPHAVTASFEPIATYTLTIVKPPGGFVFSRDDGGNTLQCGGSYNSGAGYTKCSAQRPQGSTIDLGFVPNVGMTKIIWGGDCAAAGGGNVCTVRMDAARSVSANFTP